MRRLILIATATSLAVVAACSEPTATADRTATAPSDANATTTAPVAELVHVKIRNDAQSWTLRKLSVLPHNTHDDFWVVRFGTVGLKQSRESHQTVELKKGESLTVDFSVIGSIKGWQSKVRAAAAFTGAVAAGAKMPEPRLLSCGPKEWRRVAAHEYIVEFQMSQESRDALSKPLCR
ncbi:MAG: hypothetical protein M3081_06195 [Gemmatimonadota bacterium]|nr:hypothetical protein [Gemmatimonadota bacterium]